MVCPRLYFDLSILRPNDTIASLDLKSQLTLQDLDIFALIGVKVCWRLLRSQRYNMRVIILDDYFESECALRACNPTAYDSAIETSRFGELY